MKINYDIIAKKGLTETAKTLSTNLRIFRDLYFEAGDKASEIDIYLHAYSHAHDALKLFVEENKLISMTENEAKSYETISEFRTKMLATFAYEFHDETPNQTKEYAEKRAHFNHFIRLVATLAYHRYRYDNYPEDRTVEERNCIYSWLEVRKYNRDHSLLIGFSDEELMVTLMAWFNQSILAKTPDLFDQVELKKTEEILHKYEGRRPNVPSSEMAEGYDFDLAI
jgi:hypothetical protein